MERLAIGGSSSVGDPALIGALLLPLLLAPGIALGAGITTKRPVVLAPTAPPQACEKIKERAEALRSKLDAVVSAQARAAGEQYVARPAPGSSKEKAWVDFSAHALLYGDAEVSAWATLNAVRIRMGGDTLTSAGIALSYLGSTPDALAFLNCAYALGHRRPNLLEALAVIHHEQGKRDESHRYIGEAREADSQDPLIEIAHSLITTGKPPPPQPPRPTGGYERCLAELEDHSRTVLGRIKDRADRFKAITGQDLSQYVQIMVTFHEKTLAYQRGLLKQAKGMGDAATQAAYSNNLIGQCVSVYFHFTGNLLESYFGTIYSDYTAVVFWADALGIDPAPYWREQRGASRDSTPNRYGLSLPSEPYITKLWANVGSSIKDCPAQRSAHQQEAAHSRQRFQRAGMRFDEIALPLMNVAENEILAARAFAVRMAGELKAGGPTGVPGKGIPGAGGKAMTIADMVVQGINMSYRQALLDTWLDRQVPEFFNELSTAFQRDRQNNEQSLQERKRQIDQLCPAIPPELLEALLAEQWKAYRDGLWAALLSNFEMKWDGRLNCDFSIDGFSGQIFDDGDYNVGMKRKVFNCRVGKGGAGTIGAGPFKTTVKDGEVTSVSVEGSNWQVTSDGSGVSQVSVDVKSVDANFPPFTGGGKLTIGATRDKSGRMEPRVGFSGKLGLGFKTKAGGAGCYPGTGSVSVTPRKAMQDAIKYALAEGSRR